LQFCFERVCPAHVAYHYQTLLLNCLVFDLISRLSRYSFNVCLVTAVPWSSTGETLR
jgi:hypothetical protein